MLNVKLTGLKPSRHARSTRCWVAFAALVALLSLQVSAANHVHGSADLQHCDVCVQSGQAPLAASVELPVLPNFQLPITPVMIASAPTLTPTRVVIRGPPITP